MTDSLADLFRLSLITPDGAVHNLNDLATYVAEDSDGFGMPPFHRLRQRSPEQHGETDAGFRLDPRILRFKLNARANTPAVHYARRAELLGLFAPSNDPLTLRVTLPEDGGAGSTVRDIACYFEKGLSFGAPSRRGLVQGAELVLRAPDPTFFDPAEKQASWAIDPEVGFVFPVYFPAIFGLGSIAGLVSLAYAGSWSVQPVIDITGPVTDPKIENLSTGEKIQLEYAVGGGERVTIDTRDGHKTVSNNSGANLMDRLTADSDLATFHIDHEVAGKVNNFLATGTAAVSGETEIKMIWHDRFIGI